VTISQYARAIEHAESWLRSNQRPPLRLCQWPDIKAYFESRPETHASRALTRSSLQAYWHYLGRKFPGKLRVPSRPEMKSKALEPEDLEKVLIQARNMGVDVEVACSLAYYAGFRRAEIRKAKWEDFGEGWLRVVGKGYREARLPIHPKLAEVLERVPRRSRYVLPSPRDPSVPIADGTLNLWLSAIRLATGINVSPHVLRHTAITEVNDRTGRLRDAQGFARHLDPRVTSGYTRLKARRLRAAVESL
jgi:integrase